MYITLEACTKVTFYFKPGICPI